MHHLIIILFSVINGSTHCSPFLLYAFPEVLLNFNQNTFFVGSVTQYIDVLLCLIITETWPFTSTS